MLADAKNSNLGFKLTIVSAVAMFAVPLTHSVLVDDQELSLLAFSAWTLSYAFLFFLFLRAASLLFGPVRHLILLLALDYAVLAGAYVVVSHDPDNLAMLLIYMPITVAGSYYLYCAIKKTSQQA